MFGLIFGVIIFTIAIVARFLPVDPAIKRIRNLASTVGMVIGGLVGAGGSVGYNDAGYQQHVRTIFGTETVAMDTGWYFEGWGTSTAWPKYITVAHTSAVDAEGSAITAPYRVRLADNWTGDVTQSTRFQLPADPTQFVDMARAFRSPERLITTTLRPAVTASLDSVANMFTMEEYYAGGARDQFKTEFSDAVTKGRARVRQEQVVTNQRVVQGGQAPNDLAVAEDTAAVGETDVRRTTMVKVTDASGNAIRITHDYSQWGIIVAQAILENLDPDDRFEDQIQARKDAASRRIVAREQRLEQEEQRLLAIQQGETDIAKRQAAARTEQIQRTTDAETEKQLALIAAEQQRQEAEIARATAAINLERARIDAEAVTVAADAEAYAKEAILEADGALAQKLEAWTTAQRYWADAASKINVPATVFSTGSGEAGTAGNALGTVEQFMSMMMMRTAQELQVEPTITK
jgi:regulator of protease activity HflC (stomatin/prohibitin superfamily)